MSTGATAVRVVEQVGDERDIILWRVDQFRQLGFGDDEVWTLALSPDADLGEARRLGSSGCPIELALRILL
jgi:hypothetical protein